MIGLEKTNEDLFYLESNASAVVEPFINLESLLESIISTYQSHQQSRQNINQKHNLDHYIHIKRTLQVLKIGSFRLSNQWLKAVCLSDPFSTRVGLIHIN